MCQRNSVGCPEIQTFWDQLRSSRNFFAVFLQTSSASDWDSSPRHKFRTLCTRARRHPSIVFHARCHTSLWQVRRLKGGVRPLGFRVWSFVFPHFSLFFFFSLLGWSKSDFFGLNCCTICCNISYKQVFLFEPSPVWGNSWRNVFSFFFWIFFLWLFFFSFFFLFDDFIVLSFFLF